VNVRPSRLEPIFDARPWGVHSLAPLFPERKNLPEKIGDAFGAPGHLRISYATSIERIDEGLKRIAHFFGAGS